jgi:hypothetical protein
MPRAFSPQLRVGNGGLGLAAFAAVAGLAPHVAVVTTATFAAPSMRDGCAAGVAEIPHSRLGFAAHERELVLLQRPPAAMLRPLLRDKPDGRPRCPRRQRIIQLRRPGACDEPKADRAERPGQGGLLAPRQQSAGTGSAGNGCRMRWPPEATTAAPPWCLAAVQ